MKITTIGEIGWALAYDANVTSPMAYVLECLQLGCKVQETRRPGLGASKYVDYTPIFRIIESFPLPQRAVGHYLYGPWDTEQANTWLDEASKNIEHRLYINHPNFKKWSKAKKAKVWFVIQTALMTHRQCEIGHSPHWSPQRIRQHMIEHFGERLETRYWERNWKPCWNAIEEAIDEINSEILTPVGDMLMALAQIDRGACA